VHTAPRPERRNHSRGDALLALSRLLDAARRDGELDAVAVSDESGVLVAGAGRWDECEELAAIAPLRQNAPPANDVVPTRMDVMVRRTEVRRLSVDGVEVLLAGSGGGQGRDAALTRAAEGCARILGERHSARA
jgi:hypothetical protein